MKPRVYLRWLAASAVSAALACDPDPSPPDDSANADVRAAGHGAQSIDGMPGLIHLGHLFRFVSRPGVDLSDPDAVREHALTSVYNRLAIAFSVLGCEPQLTTDDERQISLSFTGCRLVQWEADIDLDATLQVETTPCATGECPVDVRWDLDATELAFGLVGRPKGRFMGPIEIQAPLDPEQRMHWATPPGFVIETRTGLRYDALSSADWTVDDDNCMELDIGVRLVLEQREDELDEQLGDLVLAARGLRRCPGQCSEAGRAQMSFASGRVLSWTYDGDEVLRVTGPRGREVEITLPCAADRPAPSRG